MSDSESIFHTPIVSLRPYSRNARIHSARQIRQIADSIREFGFTSPILIDAGKTVLAGHARLEAAKLLGLESVPTLCIDHLSEAQKRAYVIADNRLAEISEWDRDVLALELKDLIEIDTGFEVGVTGFEGVDLDILLSPDTAVGDDPADRLPDLEETGTPVTEPGDLWLLGEHRLLCGDATSADAFDRLMESDLARMVAIDPPYNVPIDGHVSGLGINHHREFAMASGEMDEAGFTRFLSKTFVLHARHSSSGAIHFVCMDWRHLGETLRAGHEAYTEFKNLCVWRKSNAGMGSLYRSQHELVLVFKIGTGRHVNNVELGRHGRYRSNVWDYAGVNTFGAGRDDQLAMHPTVKPVQMVADMVLDCSNRGDIVLDGFAGSGTTLIACHRTGRKARLMEIDPAYCDTIVRRWQAYTGDVARHAETLQAFDDIEGHLQAKEPIDD